ncbi:MAG: CRISPR-associated endonuclease Cas1 3 [Herpetosiphonaceae bacterium]|nr:MAG: CRISPR-associated endonuclease Cas1 3 [Herpetosiphonaceae bacterium]
MKDERVGLPPPEWGPVCYSNGVEAAMGTLYLTEQYSIVKREGEALLVEIPGDKEQNRERRKVRVPLIRVDHVVIFGEITLTASVIQLLLERRISIHYLTAHGRSCGSIAPDPSKNALLRIAQHRAHADHRQRFELARRFITGKLRNMRTILMRYERKREQGEAGEAAEHIKAVLRDLQRLRPRETVDPDDRMHGLGELIGCEGAGSGAYFRAFGTLLQEPWSFSKRLRRPPRDPVNALLSLGYVILTKQAASLINIVGLDPYIGYLHSPGFGKPALALDIIEEFRPLVIDPVVISMLNTGAFQESDFHSEPGSVRLSDGARKRFLEKIEERLNTTIQHPYFGYKTSYRRCIELQVRLLGKALLGEVPEYIPFIVR